MKINQLLCALTAMLLTATALAAGTHAGGHGTAAIGEAGKAHQVTRTVKIDMDDTMRYTPSKFTAKRGETIRFIVENKGKLKHEFVLGTDKDLKEHYEVMKKFPEMEHEDDNMLSVPPGQTKEMLWKFSNAGTVSFACLHPGHYDRGMRGKIAVKKS